VPRSFREACWNVGATRWQTIRYVVLPNSVSGILTGVILQVSRTAGETAPVMFTGAVFYKAIKEGDIFAYGLFDQCMALSMRLPHRFAPHCEQVILFHRRGLAAVDPNLALIGPQEAEREPQQNRFAGIRIAGDAEHLAARQRETDVSQRRDIVKADGDVAKFDCGRLSGVHKKVSSDQNCFQISEPFPIAPTAVPSSFFMR
jgi:hypothetical protein